MGLLDILAGFDFIGPAVSVAKDVALDRQNVYSGTPADADIWCWYLRDNGIKAARSGGEVVVPADQLDEAERLMR